MYSINTHICNENMYEAIYWGFPGGAGVKNLPANAGETRDVSLIPGSGRSPRIGNGNPLQYSCLENPMNRGAWRATVYGVAECECACTHARTHTHTHTTAIVSVLCHEAVNGTHLFVCPLPSPHHIFPILHQKFSWLRDPTTY